jgi:hypothetical protein
MAHPPCRGSVGLAMRFLASTVGMAMWVSFPFFFSRCRALCAFSGVVGQSGRRGGESLLSDPGLQFFFVRVRLAWSSFVPSVVHVIVFGMLAICRSCVFCVVVQLDALAPHGIIHTSTNLASIHVSYPYFSNRTKKLRFLTRHHSYHLPKKLHHL